MENTTVAVANLSAALYPPNSTEKNLRKQVCLLTALLNGIGYEDPKSVERAQANAPVPSNLEKLAMWQNIAFMLAADFEGDHNASRCIAVTGVVESELVHVRTMTTPRNTNVYEIGREGKNMADLVEGKNEMQLIPAKHRDDVYVEALLTIIGEKTPWRDVSFEDHADDVFTALQYIQRKCQGDHRLGNYLIYSMSLFILYRTRTKQSARFAWGKDRWGGTHPLKRMVKIYRKNMKLTTEASLLRLGDIIPDFLQKQLDALQDPEKLPVEQMADGKHIWLSEAHLPGWITIVERHYDSLNHLLCNSEGRKISADQPVDVEELYDTLYSLNKLIKCGLFRILIEDSPRVRDKLAGSHIRRQNSDTGGNALDSSDDEYEDADAIHNEKAPPSIVARYLRTLTACLTSTMEIVRGIVRPRTPTLEFRRVQWNLSSPGLVPQDFTDFFADLKNAVRTVAVSEDELDNLQTVIERYNFSALVRNANNSSVHPETALMHLIYQSNDDLFSRTHQWSIGVSKKCCGCCVMFSNYLHREQKGLDITLPGTHATIFRWLPPLGTSQTILHSMCQELLGIYYQHIASSTRSLKSSQTSPAASDESSPEINQDAKAFQREFRRKVDARIMHESSQSLDLPR